MRVAHGIGVEQEYVAPHGGADANIIAPREANVLRQDNQANVRELFADQRHTPVGGSIVHHDHLGAGPPVTGSRTQRMKTLAEQARYIPIEDNYAQQWVTGSLNHRIEPNSFCAVALLITLA